VLDLCQRLSHGGHHAWLVGGCVRDSLLSQLAGESSAGTWHANDWDLATDATPEQVTSLFRRVIPTGIDHGTVTVILHDVPLEVTTLRADGGYADGRRPDQIDFVKSIEEDLARRDFTINAIAFEPDTERLIDPFDGVADLKRRRLSAVGEASRSSSSSSPRRRSPFGPRSTPTGGSAPSGSEMNGTRPCARGARARVSPSCKSTACSRSRRRKSMSCPGAARRGRPPSPWHFAAWTRAQRSPSPRGKVPG
jgi:tRNA nucleotidyltransferase (CCA-adding enzyme)